MNVISSPAAGTAASLQASSGLPSRAGFILVAANALLPLLERGWPIGSSDLRNIMTDAFGGSDAEGVWLWKDAYEACEVAQVLFLKTFGAAITARANNPQSALSMLTRVARLVPTHTRRSDESQALPLVQQDPRARLMVNGKSGRPAVTVPTRSIMLEDGSIQSRVSLIRPMDELRFEVRQLEETNWEEADEPAFIAAWNTEVADVPEYSTSTFHNVTGLLLPIWRLLPQDYCRVYRLQTDEGERIVGRRIAPEDMSRLCRNFGIETGLLLTPQQVWASLIDGSSIVGLAGNMTLRRVKVMNDYRVELTGFSDGMRSWLKAAGLFSEMIAWKVRFFIPTGEEGPAILARLMQRHPLTDIASRS